MKYFKVLFIFLYCTNLQADMFDVVDKDTKKVIYPMTKKEYRQFVPLISRELTEEEIKEKQKQNALAEKEAKEVFVKKDEIVKSKKTTTTIKTDSADIVFFDSLKNKDKNNAPVNIEEKIETNTTQKDEKPIVME